MRKKAFFENLGAILTFALIGTVISTFVIALIVYGFAQFITHTVAFKFIDMVYFGAIISATDPVTVLSIFSVIINFSFAHWHKIPILSENRTFDNTLLNDEFEFSRQKRTYKTTKVLNFRA